MRVKPLLGLIPALVILAGCEFDDFGDVGRYHEDFHYNYPLKAGGRVAVESFNGGVEISVWDQENVDISGTRYARTQSAISEVRIDVEHTPEAVSIRTTRPTERMGNFGARFVIKVPRKAVLDRVVTSNGSIRATELAGPARLKTSNGGIHVQDFVGELNAETSNGSVELNQVEGPITAHTSNSAIRGRGLRGQLDLTTSNGGIDLALEGTKTPEIRAHTSNAGITVRLPAGANARVSASTSNGSISSDFEVTTRGEISRNRMEGTLGSGGPLLDLHTSNGSVRIVR